MFIAFQLLLSLVLPASHAQETGKIGSLCDLETCLYHEKNYDYMGFGENPPPPPRLAQDSFMYNLSMPTYTAEERIANRRIQEKAKQKAVDFMVESMQQFASPNFSRDRITESGTGVLEAREWVISKATSYVIRCSHMYKVNASYGSYTCLMDGLELLKYTAKHEVKREQCKILNEAAYEKNPSIRNCKAESVKDFVKHMRIDVLYCPN